MYAIADVSMAESSSGPVRACHSLVDFFCLGIGVGGTLLGLLLEVMVVPRTLPAPVVTWSQRSVSRFFAMFGNGSSKSSFV
jgi:hypothetical protein